MFARKSLLIGALAITPLGVQAAPNTHLPAQAKIMLAQQRALKKWWPKNVEAALKRARDNRAQLTVALQTVPVEQREGLQFLLLNMPDSDLNTLSAKFLLDHLNAIYTSWNRAPWKDKVPHEIFLNDVLPYASLNEQRESWAPILRDQALPLVQDTKTPAAAAMLLNQKLFPLVNVRYSTQRQRPDQSPSQSMGSGLASCSGLSILLVDACRAVGVPARVVGTPLWTNGRGNHTWVEIWDGEWKFLGAAEPDEKGLNHAWFAGDAALAKKDVPENAIYATSFRKTDTIFPMVWDEKNGSVSAINVTARYAPTEIVKVNKTRVLFKVIDADNHRVASKVVVSDSAGQPQFSGFSRDETADLNNFLSVGLLPGAYQIKVNDGDAQTFTVADKTEQLVTTKLPGIDEATANALQDDLTKYFTASPQAQAAWQFSARFENALRTDENAVRQIAWQAYKAAPIHGAAKTNFDANQATFGEYLSPYKVRQVGEKLANGWGLVIAMHGGGGAPKEVNDSQWDEMTRHYKDHPEKGGYLYLALRAPNDTWNGFYDDYVYPLVGNLIQQFTLFGDVDANKVYLIGYSHGGYGAFAIGPKTPDRFAAIHASAAAGTDGETAPKNLRNTPFSVTVGEQDTMYDRMSRTQRFAKEIEALRGERTDIYPVTAEIAPGFQHGNLQDRDQLVAMLPLTRNSVPRDLTWLMTDTVVRDFFWLHTDAPAKEREIDAICRDNQLTVKTQNVPDATVYLDSRLIDFDQPLQIEINGQKSERKLAPSLRTLCETLQRRGDPDLAFTAQIAVK